MSNKKYVDPKTVVLKDLVQPGKVVRFSFYREKEFWYEHQEGFTFPIALDEVEGPRVRATLLAEDKAIYFMRWMKKYIDACKKEIVKSETPSQSSKTKLTEKERAKGRSEGYWEMSPEDQWAEDKRLGILDWDGK